MMGEPLYCGVGRRVERRCEAWGIHMYIFMYDWVRINQSQGGKIPLPQVVIFWLVCIFDEICF